MEKLTGACIIGQSGGPTAVINASAQGVIQTALKCLDCIQSYSLQGRMFCCLTYS